MGGFYRHWDSPILARLAKWERLANSRAVIDAIAGEPASVPMTSWRGKSYALDGDIKTIAGTVALNGFGIERLHGDGSISKVRAVV